MSNSNPLPIGSGSIDLLAMGRSSIDLYSNDSGAPFEEIKSFGAFIGGSPTNIAVGTRRLGVKSALLTAVGQDKVGDFIIHFLNKEGVITDFIPRKPETRSSAVLLGIQPPDTFPLVYYRDNCADINLTIDDVIQSPLADSKAFQFSGTNLSKEPSRSATFFATEQAQALGKPVFFDLDFRADQWHDPRAYGLMVRAIMNNVDVAIGTEEEINAAMLSDPKDIIIRDQQISAPEIRGDIDKNIETLLTMPNGPSVLVVKRGADGATIHTRDGKVESAEGFPVDITNVLGAGDAFASGFIYGCLKGWSLHKSARMGNACGAIVVTRQGCADFMAYEEEAMAFANERGGL